MTNFPKYSFDIEIGEHTSNDIKIEVKLDNRASELLNEDDTNLPNKFKIKHFDRALDEITTCIQNWLLLSFYGGFNEKVAMLHFGHLEERGKKQIIYTVYYTKEQEVALKNLFDLFEFAWNSHSNSENSTKIKKVKISSLDHHFLDTDLLKKSKID